MSAGLSSSLAPHVVVVGGGMAGVAAAQRLVQEGLTHVKILEARDRVGGRIWTQYLGSDTTLELGANWIHGSIGNPIYELAKQHGLLRDEVKPGDLDRPTVGELKNGKFLMPGGKVMDEAVVDSFLQNYNEMIEECCAVFEQGMPSQPVDSIGEFLSRELGKQLVSSNDTDASVKCTKMALLQHFLKYETCDNGCHDMREVSLKYFGQYNELEGDHNNTSDFSAILDLILKTIPPDCIAYNKKVQCIRWKEEGQKRSDSAHAYDTHGVEVECEDGQVFSADHVIVTVPLGFLKKNSRTLFQPPLPEEKLASIERMGFGVVNKIFLTFQEPFWDTEYDALHLVWDQDESNPKTPKEWYKKTYCFYIDSKAPKTLMGFISGKEAEYMETLSEEEISNTFLSLLKKFTGKDDIPKPVRTMITRWGSDALTCGSYSYIHVGEKGDDISTVAEPLYRDNTEVPAVQFAGEATHSEFFSTVHGAYLSGQREANRLVNLYGNSENGTRKS
ncbi:spermine oxidase-like [Branchiostoma floridae]|uniref:Spermine oxidase-like n=1 Tax=Branchiostoma floridae TaxID=7739 RepID=A0A9J7L1H2_BRAFL|nr:spermine oxidase-like [Branchiostoma floridae]